MKGTDELVQLLDDAAAVVAEYGAMNLYCRFDTGAEFAAEIRALHERVARQDWSALGRLVGIFAPTGPWDDGVGGEGMHIANQIMAILDKMEWSRLIPNTAAQGATMGSRVPRGRYPWWVKLSMWGVPGRADLWAFFVLSVVAAIGCVVYGFWDERYFYGIGFLLSAMMYWASIRWVDLYGSWGGDEPSETADNEW